MRLSHVAFAAYDAAMSIVVWTVLAPRGVLRAVLGRSTWDELQARLGRWTLPPSTGPARPLLVHAVSAGEVAAAASLISAITTRDPGLRIVLTTGNREGRTAAESLRRRFPAIVAVSSLPWDRGRALRTWLAGIDPRGVVVVEAEIWPGLFRGAESLGIPVLVVNGRIGPGEARRYRLALPFFRRVLDACTWIGVQSDEDRHAFLRIGAAPERVEVAGNLKMDRQVEEAQLPEAWSSALHEVTGAAELVVAGSTHHPEERWLIDALRRLRSDRRGTRLVLALRHPRRAPRVLQAVESAGFRAALWSSGPSTGWDVLVVDRLGPLAALYPYADVAVIGGSLARGGGHNPVEAAAAARPVLIGRSHRHARDIVRGLEQAGGCRVLAAHGDPREMLHRALAELLADHDLRRAMGEKAAGYCRSRQGAAARCAQAILSRTASSDRASTGTAPGIP